MIAVSVCICTFRRPQLLRRLLSAVFSQNIPDCRLEVVVVDNDPQQSAANVLAEFKAEHHDQLIVLNLSQPNISLARNAAIRASSGEWICMIDDDEIPRRDWLLNLFSTQKKYAADVVFAPVLPEYQDGVPEWIKKGGYFDRRRLPTGTVIDHRDARSGNVLVRRTTLEQITQTQGGAEGPFDPAFGRTGGEDSMLFRRLDESGSRMVWCDDAPALEFVPVDRARAMWLLQRSFRTGQLFMRTELAMCRPSQRSGHALWLSFRAVAQMGIASVFVVALTLFAPLKAFHWARITASQLGKLSHFRGKAAEAYGR